MGTEKINSILTNGDPSIDILVKRSGIKGKEDREGVEDFDSIVKTDSSKRGDAK
jgi:hypothetical protein